MESGLQPVRDVAILGHSELRPEEMMGEMMPICMVEIAASEDGRTPQTFAS